MVTEPLTAIAVVVLPGTVLLDVIAAPMLPVMASWRLRPSALHIGLWPV